jgi:hypothetical protein
LSNLNHIKILNHPIMVKTISEHAMKNKFVLTTATLLLATTTSTALADVEKELQIYNRCYAQFVRFKAPDSDKFLKQVKNGSKSGSEACMQLLALGNLQADGEIKKDGEGYYDPVGMRIFKTFTEFHKTWFTGYRYTENMGQYSTYDIHDSTEPALWVSKAMFDGEAPYRSVITGDSTLVSKRINQLSGGDRVADRSVIKRGNKYDSVSFTLGNAGARPESNDELNTWTPPLAPVGKLVGLEERAQHLTDMIYSLGGREINVFHHHHGGVMGSNAYLLSNLTIRVGGYPDGGLAVNRRWSQSVVRDFFCRELPVLRTRDAISYVPSEESPVSFKNGLSCMKCHATIDPMAGNIRHLTRAQASRHNGDTNKHLNSLHIMRHPASETMEPEEGWPDKDNNYAKRPTNGMLHFRSYTGDLVKAQTANMSELGDAIADTNDYYACAVKRYLHFMTGVNVRLTDLGDFGAVQPTESEAEYRQFVHQTALEFKEHQNPQEVIAKILQSNFYLNPENGLRQ